MDLKIGKAIDYDILISPSSNFGFIVKVGCGRFIAASIDDLLDGLKQFLQMPDVFMKEYNGISSSGPLPDGVDVPPTMRPEQPAVGAGMVYR